MHESNRTSFSFMTWISSGATLTKTQFYLYLIIASSKLQTTFGVFNCDLSCIKTTGKTGKLTKQLLALKPGTQSQQKRREAILYALERRVDRLQRWQRRTEQVSVPVQAKTALKREYV